MDLNVGKKVPTKKETKESSEPVDNQKIMELLELEMRARAIKSLLSRTKKDDPSNPTSTSEPPKKEESKKDDDDDDDEQFKLVKEVQDPEESKKQLEEQKKLHKGTFFSVSCDLNFPARK